MTFPSCAPSGDACYRLVLEAEPESNVLLRLLEPFVIHDVLPHHLDVARQEDCLSVELLFSASEALAERLAARMRAMVSVRDVLCEPVIPLARRRAARVVAA
ncbi:hypothetical protein V5F77_01445 [Xanthobacter sp. DSM 24535]|uniref:hypothetical protein n=1 Tax=Roseixanthobacter psychrophilus TaxID=3119917 RepID=UPI003726560D